MKNNNLQTLQGAKGTPFSLEFVKYSSSKMQSKHLKNQPQWYAMGSPYGKEMKAVDILKTQENVTPFIPLKRFERMVGRETRKRKVTYRPAIRNLLFVNATELKMRELKKEYNALLQFKVRPKPGGGFEPITVPEKQMENFLAVCENADADKLEFFTPDEIDLRPNARVVIQDGIFEGREGYYQQVRSKVTKKGKKEKRFVVVIDGFLACAAVLAECTYVSVKK